MTPAGTQESKGEDVYTRSRLDDDVESDGGWQRHVTREPHLDFWLRFTDPSLESRFQHYHVREHFDHSRGTYSWMTGKSGDRCTAARQSPPTQRPLISVIFAIWMVIVVAYPHVHGLNDPDEVLSRWCIATAMCCCASTWCVMRFKVCRDIFLQRPILWQLWALGVIVGIFGMQGYYFYSRLVETDGDTVRGVARVHIFVISKLTFRAHHPYTSTCFAARTCPSLARRRVIMMARRLVAVGIV